MGVLKYQSKGQTYWQVDETVTLPDGREQRYRKRKIPTKEQALALISKIKAEAFEGRYFDRVKPNAFTVADAWALYEPVNKRDSDAWITDRGRAKHLLRHLGGHRAERLNQESVDGYRTLRLGERTKRGEAPAPATLDREVELLKRMLNYAVKCTKLAVNPIARVSLLGKSNVRRVVLKEETFAKLVEAADPHLRPILLVAYDTGMRKQEVLALRWSQLDLREGCITLAPEDTKTDQGRVIYLTTRAVTALRELPRGLKGGEWVFVNPQTGERWKDIRKMFQAACTAAELEGVWFHDTRRSFATNARRRGVPESVVMRMTGHRTRAVFDRYNIVEDEDLRAAVRRIEAGQALRQESVKVGEG